MTKLNFSYGYWFYWLNPPPTNSLFCLTEVLPFDWVNCSEASSPWYWMSKRTVLLRGYGKKTSAGWLLWPHHCFPFRFVSTGFLFPCQCLLLDTSLTPRHKRPKSVQPRVLTGESSTLSTKENSIRPQSLYDNGRTAETDLTGIGWVSLPCFCPWSLLLQSSFSLVVVLNREVEHFCFQGATDRTTVILSILAQRLQGVCVTWGCWNIMFESRGR